MGSHQMFLPAAGVAILLLSSACSREPFPETDATSVGDYWFDKAEITRYALVQERYGEQRRGESVLVFVTEPFLPEQQVKDETGAGAAVPVLKLNRIREFVTGVYDYRMMASVFQPVEMDGAGPSALKVAMASTEWCGLAFQQVNRRDGELEVQLRSYFQSEGDQDKTLPAVFLEDALWVRIRLDPASLPEGEFDVFPETFYQRLAHLQPEIATARGRLDAGGEVSTYRLAYPALERTLEIRFESAFPHRILSWREEVDGRLFSRGEATHSERLYYWQDNARKDEPLRESLGVGTK